MYIAKRAEEKEVKKKRKRRKKTPKWHKKKPFFISVGWVGVEEMVLTLSGGIAKERATAAVCATYSVRFDTFGIWSRNHCNKIVCRKSRGGGAGGKHKQ